MRASHGPADHLEEIRLRLDRRFDEIEREYAGRPEAEVFSALEREVCAAGVTPIRPDLSALARSVSRGSAGS